MKVLARPGVLSVRVGSPDIKARVFVWVEVFIEILIVRDRWPPCARMSASSLRLKALHSLLILFSSVVDQSVSFPRE